MKNTTNYELKKPDGTDAVDIAIINQNMDTIDTTMKSNASQIKSLEGQIQNINVSGDVRQVINERVNADTSKPLSTLISEWVNGAKTALLNAVSTLTTHVTSQHTATKNHVTTKVDALPQKSVWTDARGAKLDNLNQSMTTTQTNMNNNTNAARDNIKNHMDVARDNIKNHITASRGGDVAGKTYVKATKTVANTGNPNSNLEVINYTNAKGGVCKISQFGSAKMQIIVDGAMVLDGAGSNSYYSNHEFIQGNALSESYGELPTYPFKNNVKVVDRSSNAGTRVYTAHFYVNS